MQRSQRVVEWKRGVKWILLHFATFHFCVLEEKMADGRRWLEWPPWPQPGCGNLAKTMDVMDGVGMNVVGGKTVGLAPSVRNDGEWRELVKLATRNEILVVRFHPFPALGIIRT